MNWIDVSIRVPCDRRQVLCWGQRYIAGMAVGEPRLLGWAKFNMCRDGGQFSIATSHGLTSCRVTHWAEIVGPAETE